MGHGAIKMHASLAVAYGLLAQTSDLLVIWQQRNTLATAGTEAGAVAGARQLPAYLQ